MAQRTLCLATCLVALLFGVGAASAESDPTTESNTEPVAEAAAVEAERATPRSTMLGYLEACRADDFESAARFLNLSPIPPGERDARGPLLAQQLKQVLDRRLWIDIEELSDSPDGERDDGLPSNRDRVGRIEAEAGGVDIFVDRLRLREGGTIWKISPATVARIPELSREFGQDPLAKLLPAPFTELRLFEIALWQWLALLVLVVGAYLVAWLLAGTLARALGPLVARSDTELDDRILAVIIGPLRLLATVGLFSAGSLLLGLTVPTRRVLGGIEETLAIFGFTWLLFRLVDLSALVLATRLRERGKAGAMTAIPLGSRALKVAIGALATLAALDTFGFNVTAVIAGLGVGGIAVALAAQKTIENVFGGVTVLTDQPVRVGDFCRFGDQVGTVEDIGLRSTRLRTLARTVVTVPNADFSAMHLENFALRDRILLNTKLGLRYETSPEQLRYVLVELRRMLYAHPEVTNDPARVRFVGFGDFSLDLEVFCYVATSDWNAFLGVREDLFLRMMDVVEASGSGFAFPSQTAYLAQDGGIDAEKAQAAETQVAQWRREQELMLPEFPADRIAELGGSLEYPPEGSSTNRRD